MASPQATLTRCPECGYETAGFLTRCPLCGGTLLERDAAERVDSERIGNPISESNGFSFSLSTLMLVVTLACVGMGGIVAAPGVTIPLLVISVPALARTWATGRREMERGRSWGTTEKIAALAVSMGLMLLISAAGCIAFCVACFAGCWGAMLFNSGTNSLPGENAFVMAIGFGVATGIGLMIYLMWKNWPSRKR
jgi:hypothetical protein